MIKKTVTTDCCNLIPFEMAYVQFLVAVLNRQLNFDSDGRLMKRTPVNYGASSSITLSLPLLIAAVIFFSNCLCIEHGSQGFKRLNRNLTPLLKHSDLLVCCGTDSAVSCYSFLLLKMSYNPKLKQFTFLHTNCGDD